jgi:hypothetical protein
MLIYARQVAPEYQTSPLEYSDIETEYPGIIIDGNDRLRGYTTPLYDRIIQVYDDAAEYLDELKTDRGNATYRNVSEIIADFFPALEYRTKPYSTRDINRIRRALELYGTADYYDGDYIIAMLSAIMGQEYESATIRGCCQSEWNNIIYPAADYSADDINRLELDYFNAGTEWIIHDGPAAPEDAAEISGYSVYCYGWDPEQIRAEIADAAGANASDVIMYEYDGCYTLPKYKKLGA